MFGLDGFLGLDEDCLASKHDDGTIPHDYECDKEFFYICIDKWAVTPWETCNMGTCRTWGDPHVKTFDGLRNDIYGQATYLLSQTTEDAMTNRGLPFFSAAMETLQVRPLPD